MDGQESQIHDVWTFGKDRVTREVPPTARVDVGAGFVGEFATNYLTEYWRRIPMFGVNSINGSVQWLGVPAPLSTNGSPGTDNTFAPSFDWRTGGTDTNPNWGRKPGGAYGSVAVLWSGPACVMPSYIQRSLENTCSAASRVRDNLLHDNLTAHM